MATMLPSGGGGGDIELKDYSQTVSSHARPYTYTDSGSSASELFTTYDRNVPSKNRKIVCDMHTPNNSTIYAATGIFPFIETYNEGGEINVLKNVLDDNDPLGNNTVIWEQGLGYYAFPWFLAPLQDDSGIVFLATGGRNNYTNGTKTTYPWISGIIKKNAQGKLDSSLIERIDGPSDYYSVTSNMQSFIVGKCNRSGRDFGVYAEYDGKFYALVMPCVMETTYGSATSVFSPRLICFDSNTKSWTDTVVSAISGYNAQSQLLKPGLVSQTPLAGIVYQNGKNIYFLYKESVVRGNYRQVIVDGSTGSVVFADYVDCNDALFNSLRAVDLQQSDFIDSNYNSYVFGTANIGSSGNWNCVKKYAPPTGDGMTERQLTESLHCTDTASITGSTANSIYIKNRVYNMNKLQTYKDTRSGFKLT